MKERIIRSLRSKKGESYIDTVIMIVVAIMSIVLALNVFSYFTLKQDLDYITSEVAERAALEGYADANNAEISSLLNSLIASENLDASLLTCEITADNDAYFNKAQGKVQLGEQIKVKITYKTTLKGLGALSKAIDILCVSEKSGLSRVYWKE